MRLLKCNNSTGAKQLRQLAQNGNRIRKPHQNETAHGCIEWFSVRDLGNIGLNEAHVLQASFSHTSGCPSDRARVALDSHNFSGRTNQSSSKHRHVAHAGAKIQYTLTWANPCLTE